MSKKRYRDKNKKSQKTVKSAQVSESFSMAKAVKNVNSMPGVDDHILFKIPVMFITFTVYIADLLLYKKTSDLSFNAQFRPISVFDVIFVFCTNLQTCTLFLFSLLYQFYPRKQNSDKTM